MPSNDALPSEHNEIVGDLAEPATETDKSNIALSTPRRNNQSNAQTSSTTNKIDPLTILREQSIVDNDHSKSNNKLYEVQELENVFIPMRDGTLLAARIWLPTDATCTSNSLVRSRNGNRYSSPILRLDQLLRLTSAPSLQVPGTFHIMIITNHCNMNMNMIY
jgi:hypothetical protein